MKDIKKVCSPQGKQTDKEWQAMIMSSEANKLLVKNAVLAMERDNLDNYWKPSAKWTAWRITKREACFTLFF
ncbi:YicS family protein [Lelliottia nimipressuralis]|uniref:YicS family protein n=1 Tax=Lelliottia nimipressuralis TaxID=69220 RepID=UPI003D277FCC